MQLLTLPACTTAKAPSASPIADTPIAGPPTSTGNIEGMTQDFNAAKYFAEHAGEYSKAFEQYKLLWFDELFTKPAERVVTAANYFNRGHYDMDGLTDSQKIVVGLVCDTPQGSYHVDVGDVISAAHVQSVMEQYFTDVPEHETVIGSYVSAVYDIGAKMYTVVESHDVGANAYELAMTALDYDPDTPANVFCTFDLLFYHAVGCNQVGECVITFVCDDGIYKISDYTQTIFGEPIVIANNAGTDVTEPPGGSDVLTVEYIYTNADDLLLRPAEKVVTVANYFNRGHYDMDGLTDSQKIIFGLVCDTPQGNYHVDVGDVISAAHVQSVMEQYFTDVPEHETVIGSYVSALYDNATGMYTVIEFSDVGANTYALSLYGLSYDADAQTVGCLVDLILCHASGYDLVGTGIIAFDYTDGVFRINSYTQKIYDEPFAIDSNM